MIREAVKKKLSSLNEANDLTARRQIIQSAQTTSMTFENDIVKLLNLVPPDNLPPETQKRYLEVVKNLENAFVLAVADAVKELSRFPRNDDGSSSVKGSVK